MKCQNCGSDVPEGAKFCVNCGTRLEPPAAPAQEPQPAYQPPVQEPQQPYQPPVQEPQQPYQPPYQQPYQPPYGAPGQMPPAQPPKKSKVGLIVGIVVGALLLVLIIVAVVLIVGKPSKPTAETSEPESVAEAVMPEEEEEGYTVPPEELEDNPITDVPNLEETELFNDADVLVKATGLEFDDYYYNVKVTVLNDSDKSVYVSDAGIIVNGYQMQHAYFSSTVAAGKSAKEELCLSLDELASCGIGTITDLTICLNVMDDESYEIIAEGDWVSMETSAKGVYEQEYDSAGTVIYEDDDFLVVGRSLYEGDYAPYVEFYVENNSDIEVYFSSVYDTVSINDLMCGDSLYANLAPHTRAVVQMYIYDMEDLDLASIDDITSMEFALQFRDTDSYDTLVETDPIELTFE